MKKLILIACVLASPALAGDPGQTIGPHPHTAPAPPPVPAGATPGPHINIWPPIRS